MNKNLIKIICLVSFVLGLMFGILTLIPIVGTVAFWCLICFTSTIVILYLNKINILRLDSVQQSIVIGGLIGFVSFLGFSLIYLPILLILAKIFSIFINYGISSALNNATFFIILMLVIFVGILSATLNAFFGFLTYYGLDFMKMLNKNSDNNDENNNDNK